MSCSEKACPFPPGEGEVLCRYHRQSYAFEISMRDDALDLRAVSFDDRNGRTVEGLVVVHRKRDLRTLDEKVTGLFHQILASGRMVKRALSSIESASPATVADWTTNAFAAQELFRTRQVRRQTRVLHLWRSGLLGYCLRDAASLEVQTLPLFLLGESPNYHAAQPVKTGSMGNGSRHDSAGRTAQWSSVIFNGSLAAPMRPLGT